MLKNHEQGKHKGIVFRNGAPRALPCTYLRYAFAYGRAVLSSPALGTITAYLQAGNNDAVTAISLDLALQ